MYLHSTAGRIQVFDWKCKNHTKEVRQIPEGYHIVGVYGKYSRSMLEFPGFIVMRNTQKPERQLEIQEEKKGQ